MTRRAAVLSSLLAYVRQTQGDELHFKIGGRERSTVLAIEIDGPADLNAFYIRYNGRTATVNLEDVMDALGARRER